jgi:hypothetical protein
VGGAARASSSRWNITGHTVAQLTHPQGTAANAKPPRANVAGTATRTLRRKYCSLMILPSSDPQGPHGSEDLTLLNG